MARIRINPWLFESEHFSSCSPAARFLFFCLTASVDDMGRMLYSPESLKHHFFPRDPDISPDSVRGFVAELERLDYVKLYHTEYDEVCLWMPFHRSQQRRTGYRHSIQLPHPDDPDPQCPCVACNVYRKRNGRERP